MEDNVSLYQTGATVRLRCGFRTNNEIEELVNPIEVKIIFMDKAYEEFDRVILNKESNTESEGFWFYDYQLPMEETTIIYEWVGIYQNSQNTKRAVINTTFV